MSQAKRVVTVCDLCGREQIRTERSNAIDLEVYGLTVGRAFFAGESGGGGIPKDAFVCEDCINGSQDTTDDGRPATIRDLVDLIWKDQR